MTVQEKKNQELTKAQADTDEFVLQLDEETEGLQANIMSLQSKLDKANSRIKELEGDLEGRTDDKKEGKSENTDESSGNIIPTHSIGYRLLFLASAYYTPEQLSGYYDQLISAGYMTKEQAKEALDQVR